MHAAQPFAVGEETRHDRSLQRTVGQPATGGYGSRYPQRSNRLFSSVSQQSKRFSSSELSGCSPRRTRPGASIASSVAGSKPAFSPGFEVRYAQILDLIFIAKDAEHPAALHFKLSFATQLTSADKPVGIGAVELDPVV